MKNFVLGLLVVLAMPAAQAAVRDSNYSSLNLKKDCQQVRRRGAPNYDYVVYSCPGVGNYKAIISGEEGHSFLNVKNKVTGVETEQDFDSIRNKEGYHSYFPSLKAEWRGWRYQNGKFIPDALIIRYNTTDETKDITKSLLIIKLGEKPCPVGYVDAAKVDKANEAARGIADKAQDLKCIATVQEFTLE